MYKFHNYLTSIVLNQLTCVFSQSASPLLRLHLHPLSSTREILTGNRRKTVVIWSATLVHLPATHIAAGSILDILFVHTLVRVTRIMNVPAERVAKILMALIAGVLFVKPYSSGIKIRLDCSGIRKLYRGKAGGKLWNWWNMMEDYGKTGSFLEKMENTGRSWRDLYFSHSHIMKNSKLLFSLLNFLDNIVYIIDLIKL